MPTIAIGDIHGHLKPLREVLDLLRPTVTAADTVVFLGDYIDRGRDTRGCVDAILHFIDDAPGPVVCLRGNHEEWMLHTMRDHSRHSWLLGMDGLSAIRSYSEDAAAAIVEAARAIGGELYEGKRSLPYELFFDALPDAHRAFFESLVAYHETPDCLCTHAGVDPAVTSLAQQGRALIWGAHGFPDAYDRPRIVVYGHMNNARVDEHDWPHPRVVGNTFGLDTISHGVLTALRLPGPQVLQSARYERREELERE